MNLPLILLFITCVIWGTTFVIIKDIANEINPFQLVFLRALQASVVMFVYLFWKNKQTLLNIEAIKNGGILGILLGATYVLQTIGLKYTSSGHGAFITSAAVILVPLILFIQFKQPLKLQGAICISLVTIGLILLTYHPGTPYNIGDLITLIATIACAYHIILAGKFVKSSPVLALIFYQFLATTLLCGTISFFTVNESIQFNNSMISIILYLGLVGTLSCYFVSVWAQKKLSSVNVVIIFATEPLFASFFGYVYLNETFNLLEWLGALIIIFGVIFFDIPILNRIKKMRQTT